MIKWCVARRVFWAAMGTIYAYLMVLAVSEHAWSAVISALILLLTVAFLLAHDI